MFPTHWAVVVQHVLHALMVILERDRQAGLALAAMEKIDSEPWPQRVRKRFVPHA